MANFHENLKQSFKNFKNKYIGNVPSGVTLAQINADLSDIINSLNSDSQSISTKIDVIKKNDIVTIASNDLYTTVADVNNTVLKESLRPSKDALIPCIYHQTNYAWVMGFLHIYPNGTMGVFVQGTSTKRTDGWITINGAYIRE